MKTRLVEMAEWMPETVRQSDGTRRYLADRSGSATAEGRYLVVR